MGPYMYVILLSFSALCKTFEKPVEKQRASESLFDFCSLTMAVFSSIRQQIHVLEDL